MSSQDSVGVCEHSLRMEGTHDGTRDLLSVFSQTFLGTLRHCHNEDKKVCELEERTQPKQVKKYVYSKQCRKVPRKVCENTDNKSLVPSCVPSM